VSAVLDSPELAGFCYTQLTDTEQETNGLLHVDRTPKLDLAILRAITSRPSRAIPGDFIAAAQAANMRAAGDRESLELEGAAATATSSGNGTEAGGAPASTGGEAAVLAERETF
jgi:hypothetical protein